MNLEEIRTAIARDPENRHFSKKGWVPVYTAHASAKVLIVGQAPGRRAQASGIPWDDLSGENLRDWLGVSRETFYDDAKIALVPMDFYFPGSKARGDVAPRKGFAEKWHPLIFKELPHIGLTILIGQYSQAFYLGDRRKATLTDTVDAFKEYLPEFLPLPHPSPRNNIWQKKNPWFKTRVISKLRKDVRRLL